MSTDEDEGGPRAGSRDTDSGYGSDRTTQFFGSDGSYGFSNSLDGSNAKNSPRHGSSGAKSLFGGQTPFANMPVYTPVTRASEPPPAPREFAPRDDHRAPAESFREPADTFRSASDPFRDTAGDASWDAPESFDTQDPFSGSSLFGADSPFGQHETPTPSSRRDSAFGFDSIAEQAFDPYAERSSPPSQGGVALSSLRAHSEPSHIHQDPLRSFAESARAPAEPQRRPASDTRKAVQAFDAGYDQHHHPEVALGFSTASRPRTAPDSAFDEEEDEGVDADFLDEGRPNVVARSRAFLTKKTTMIAASLAGALLLGGSIAYLYQSADGSADGEPPVIQADSRPVKVPPKEAGGKEFPHRNKQIYDRLQGEEPTGDEQIVPREEAVAAEAEPAPPPAEEDQAQAPAAGPEAFPEEEQMAAVDTAEAPPAPAPAAATESGGPRRVKTLVVRPDGTVVQPTMAAAAPNAGSAAPAQDFASEEAAAPESVAAIPAPPLPASKPRSTARQDVAAFAPQAAPAKAAAPSAGAGQYVVQVAARKSQTEALAAFADMQQKYPQLLSGYRPMVQKADLGQRGTWYRLRVGPMGQKTAATKLCDQLRSAGLNSCLVMTE